MFASTDKYFHGVTNMKGTVTRIARVVNRVADILDAPDSGVELTGSARALTELYRTREGTPERNAFAALALNLSDVDFVASADAVGELINKLELKPASKRTEHNVFGNHPPFDDALPVSWMAFSMIFFIRPRVRSSVSIP